MVGLDRFVEWRDAGAPVFSRSQVNGQPVLQIDTSSADRGRWMSGRDIPVEPGKTYRVRAWQVDATVWAYGFEFGQVMDTDAELLGMGEVWRYPNQIVIQLQDII